MYQAGGTIRKLLDKVADGEYLLPAIQRELYGSLSRFVCFSIACCKSTRLELFYFGR